MVNRNNLRKRNAAGTTSSDGPTEGKTPLQIAEEIVKKTIPADKVRREIRKSIKRNEADGVTSPFRLSLIDPISMLRIRIPVQSTECDHFQCFDLHNFLEFSLKNSGEENKNAWLCPHCQAEAKREQLRVDGYFQEILLKVGPEPLEVELLSDGNWREVEQVDFKNVRISNMNDDDVMEAIEIAPKKKARIQEDSDETLKLRELLGIGNDGDVFEAVQNLMQKLETLEKSAQPKSIAEFGSQTEICQSFQETACQTESLQNSRENASQTETNVFVLPTDRLCEILGIAPGENVVEALQKLKRQANASEVFHRYTMNQLRQIVGGHNDNIIEAVRQLKEKADAWEKSALTISREIACQTEKFSPKREESKPLPDAEKSLDKSVNLSDDDDSVLPSDDDSGEKLMSDDEEFDGSLEEQIEEDEEEEEMDERASDDTGEEEFEETVEVVVNETPPESSTSFLLTLPTLFCSKNIAPEIDSRPACTNKENPPEIREPLKKTKQQNPVNPNASIKENPKKIETDNPYFHKRAESSQIQSPIQDDCEGHLICDKGDYITAKYKVMEILKEGKFAKMVHVKDRERRSRADFALKIFKNTSESREVARREIEVLNLLEKNDPGGQYSIVQLFDRFDFQGHKCLVFELLGPSVHDFMRENNSEPFPMDQTRKISYQLIQAVKFLQQNKLTHTQLNPENILFVNGAFDVVPRMCEGKPPLKVIRDPSIRLIGLDSAYFDHNRPGEIIASRFYHAPEITLEITWSDPCDVWSIGCIMFELYTGEILFPARDQNEHLAMIEQVLGKIPHRFDWDENSDSGVYVLKKCQPLNRYKKSDGVEDRDFFALLREMLDYEMDSRIVPDEAMKHQYFSCLLREMKKSKSIAYLVRQMNKSLKENTELYSLKILLIGNASPECPHSFLRREQGRGTELVNFLRTKVGVRLNPKELNFDDPRSMISVRYRTKAEADKIHAFFHGKALYGVEFSVSRRVEQNAESKYLQSWHAFDLLAQCPHFQKIRQLVHQNPAFLQEIIGEIEKVYPELAERIRHNQALLKQPPEAEGK